LGCDPGEGWRRFLGPIVWKMKKYYTQSRKKSYVKWKEGRLTGLLKSCVETAFLGNVIESTIKGKIEWRRIRQRRREKIIGDLKKNRSYRNLKEEALYWSLWRIRCGRGFGPVVRQNTQCNELNRAKTLDRRETRPPWVKGDKVFRGQRHWLIKSCHDPRQLN
jgi:hypothetical protein